MPDAKVRNEPSILEARKTAKKAAKRLKKAKAVKKATTRKPVAKRAAKKVAKKAPSKAWLKAGPKVRKLAPTRAAPVWKKAPILAPAQPSVSLPALRKAAPAPVGGEWDGVELIPVISSNVGSYGYREEDGTLYVRFLDNSIYAYFGVDPSVWARFQTVSSKGRFVWSDLRDKYDYERVYG